MPQKIRKSNVFSGKKKRVLPSHEKTFTHVKGKKAEGKKATHCTIPTLGHSERGNKLEKRLLVTGRELNAEQTVFRALKLLCVRHHNGGSASLPTCPNPQKQAAPRERPNKNYGLGLTCRLRLSLAMSEPLP